MTSTDLVAFDALDELDRQRLADIGADDRQGTKPPAVDHSSFGRLAAG
jgi:hypothetical protein